MSGRGGRPELKERTGSTDDPGVELRALCVGRACRGRRRPLSGRAVLACAGVLAVLAIAPACLPVELTTAGAPDLECSTKTPRPFTVGQTVDALRERGIVVYRDLDEPCTSDTVATVANMVWSGPHENIEEHERIGARTGLVVCGVRARPSPADAGAVRRFDDDDNVAFFVGNVQCSIYPEGPRSDGQVAALERALRRLGAR